jgi:hypothetical protein
VGRCSPLHLPTKTRDLHGCSIVQAPETGIPAKKRSSLVEAVPLDGHTG